MGKPTYHLSDAQAAALERLAAEHNRAPADLLSELLEPLDDDLAGETELWKMVAESDADIARGDVYDHEEVMRETQAIIDAARLRRSRGA